MYVCVLCNPCYDPYGSYGLKNGIQFLKGLLRSITCISLVGQERVYTVFSIRTYGKDRKLVCLRSVSCISFTQWDHTLDSNFRFLKMFFSVLFITAGFWLLYFQTVQICCFQMSYFSGPVAVPNFPSVVLSPAFHE